MARYISYTANDQLTAHTQKPPGFASGRFPFFHYFFRALRSTGTMTSAMPPPMRAVTS